MYRLTWRLPLAGLVAFSHLQFSQIRGRQPYLIVRNILYVILLSNPTSFQPWSAPPKPPMSHRKTDLGIPCRSKSAKVVLGRVLIKSTSLVRFRANRTLSQHGRMTE